MAKSIKSKKTKERDILNSEKIKNYYLLLVALVFIVIYFILRKFKKEEIEREEKENTTLKEILSRRINKKEKLDRKVLSYYRRTKWFLASLIIISISVAVKLFSLDSVLNYLNFALILFFLLSVAAFDRPREIIEMLKILKNQIENYVYRNDKDIHDEIEKLKSLVSDKEKRIEDLKNSNLTEEQIKEILDNLNETFEKT